MSAVELWSIEKVGHWLRVNGLDAYVELFAASEIDGDVLLLINQEDIHKRLHISGNDAKLLHDLIRSLQDPVDLCNDHKETQDDAIKEAESLAGTSPDSQEAAKKSSFFKKRKEKKKKGSNLEDYLAQSLGSEGKGKKLQ